MIIVRIIGGAGNQLFQYSFGRYLSQLQDKELYLDFTQQIEKYGHHEFILDLYNINANIIRDKDERIKIFNTIPFNRFREDQTKINKNIFITDGNIYLNGYWQSEKYFNRIEDIIRKEITLKHPINNKKYKDVESDILNSNSVAIHVRKKNYLEHYSINFYVQYDESYYNKAIDIINDKIDAPELFIFSDDIEWCRQNIDVDGNFVDLKQEGWKDMELMKQCKHFITANSTFSWWGAWLSKNKNKIVITPKKWIHSEEINNRICRGWISI